MRRFFWHLTRVKAIGRLKCIKPTVRRQYLSHAMACTNCQEFCFDWELPRYVSAGYERSIVNSLMAIWPCTFRLHRHIPKNTWRACQAHMNVLTATQKRWPSHYFNKWAFFTNQIDYFGNSTRLVSLKSLMTLQTEFANLSQQLKSLNFNPFSDYVVCSKDLSRTLRDSLHLYQDNLRKHME